MFKTDWYSIVSQMKIIANYVINLYKTIKFSAKLHINVCKIKQFLYINSYKKSIYENSLKFVI